MMPDFEPTTISFTATSSSINLKSQQQQKKDIKTDVKV